MAVNTTTISAKVLTPNGVGATDGVVQATLSAAATVADGADQHVIGGTVSADIASSGAVSLPLAPNSELTPNTTHYLFEFLVTAPVRASWSKRYTVPTTPDPCDWGDLTEV